MDQASHGLQLKHGTHWELARNHSLYADWYKKKGDNVAAKEQLARAIDLSGNAAQMAG